MIEIVSEADKHFMLLLSLAITSGGFIGYFLADWHTSWKNRLERDKSSKETIKSPSMLANIGLKSCFWNEKYYVGSNCYDTSCGVIVQQGESISKVLDRPCHVCGGIVSFIVLFDKYKCNGDKS